MYPRALDQGLCPWTPPDPSYRLAQCAPSRISGSACVNILNRDDGLARNSNCYNQMKVIRHSAPDCVDGLVDSTDRVSETFNSYMNTWTNRNISTPLTSRRMARVCLSVRLWRWWIVITSIKNYVTWNDLEQCLECNKTVDMLRHT